jgi:hypothetical protein
VAGLTRQSRIGPTDTHIVSNENVLPRALALR